MELLGAPKSGFKLTLDVAPMQLTLRSRPDPALLYLVVGAALLLGVAGAVLGAPTRSVLEAGLFAALFSPILLFLVISALRLRATCFVDRERHELVIHEQGYLGHWTWRYPLEEVGSVWLYATPPSSPLEAGRKYLLCLAVGDAAYRLAEGRSAASLETVGSLLARFLGVPLERAERPAPVQAGRRRLLIGVLLYVIPVTAAVALLGLSIPRGADDWAVPSTLAAIVLSQVAALLTLLYYRRHATGDAAVSTPATSVPGEVAPVAAGEPNRVP